MSMSRIFLKKKKEMNIKSARVARVKFKIANLGLFLLIIIIILDIWMRENDSFFCTQKIRSQARYKMREIRDKT